MKPLIFAFSALAFSATAVAQYNTSVQIRFRGNTNQQVTLDNQMYSSDDYASSGNNGNRLVTIPNVAPGTHTLRVNYTNRRRTGTTTTFTLRDGYMMTINVNGNGGIQLQEKRNRAGNTGTYQQAMSDANYTTLINNIRNTRGNGGKYNYANSMVTASGNYFTSAQVRGILSTFYGESYRLQLAKNAYAHVIDPTSFSVVYSMLGTTAARNELQAYVNANGTTGSGTTNPGSSNAGLNPMDASTFNQLYNTVNSRYNQSQRLSDLNTIFGNTSYTFSAQQVAQFINLVSNEANRLQLAKNAFRLSVDPLNYGVVGNLLSSSYDRSNLEAYIRSYTGNSGYILGQGNTSYPGSTNGSYSAMSDAQYNTLVQTVQSKWLPGAKMTELVNIFNNTSYYFSSTQAHQLISLVTDENNRLQLAKSSYRSIVDPTNISVYYDLFTSTAARNDFDAYVRANGGVSTGNTYPGSNTYRTPMSVNEYNVLVEDVKSKWLPGAKMSTLTNMMNNTTYNFSVAQAHDLIMLVSDEANRLQLAKAGFARLTDPSNYTNLYDLFTLQQSRDDLANYARSYR